MHDNESPGKGRQKELRQCLALLFCLGCIPILCLHSTRSVFYKISIQVKCFMESLALMITVMLMSLLTNETFRKGRAYLEEQVWCRLDPLLEQNTQRPVLLLQVKNPCTQLQTFLSQILIRKKTQKVHVYQHLPSIWQRDMQTNYFR